MSSEQFVDGCCPSGVVESIRRKAKVLARGGNVLVAEKCSEFSDGSSSVDLCDSVRVAE